MNQKSEEITKKVIIIGAGPAGLTAALELLRQKMKDFKITIIEADNQVGGLSKTVNYKGNRLDIGGHRFFSKSKKIMDWWLDILPLAENASEIELTYQNQKTSYQPKSGRAIDAEAVMLLRNRKSRIYYRQKFFAYPLKLNLKALRDLGLLYSLEVGLSYFYRVVFPRRPEKNLEDFFINRFGTKLYRTFFKDYTEKVWGVNCTEISAEWGAQRVKGLSIFKTIQHFIFQLLPFKHQAIYQQNTETSLIEQFLYPKYGPGQMWEQVADLVEAKGGEILYNQRVKQIEQIKIGVWQVISEAEKGEERQTFEADYVLSSMPVSDLVKALGGHIPIKLRAVARALPYRDFMVVGVLLNRLKVSNLEDNWLYIQEPGIKMGRLQIFNNWSPAMVANPDKYWLGLEYFCYQEDSLWQQPNQTMIDFAIEELSKIGIAAPEDVEDAILLRVPKTYPAYHGAYEQFESLREELDSLDNLFLIGRNGMHRYNNQDHSMLTAMQVVENILNNRQDKEAIWQINTEPEYHEVQSK